MDDKSPDDDSLTDEEIARRRDEIVKRMLATPPQPRRLEPRAAGRGRKAAPAPKTP
jgi:hypothetical protein